MNEMNTKLTKIKKSSHAGKIAAKVIFVMCIIGCIASLIASGLLLHNKDMYEPQLATAQEQGMIDTDSLTVSHFDIGSAETWHSDVPALQSFIDEYPMVFAMSTYLLIVAAVTAVAAVLMKLLGSTFASIETEDTPFNDKVIRKMLVVMIFISAMLLMTAGAAWGIVCGLATWVIYSIMDYGKTLQIQSDETL